MIIAQFVLTSAPENAIPSNNGWWWLLPLVVGVLSIVWYLRQSRNRSQAKSSSKLHQQTRASTNKPNLATHRDDSQVADTTPQRDTSANKSGKKKKKNKGKSERHAKPVALKQLTNLDQAKSGVSETKTIAGLRQGRLEKLEPVKVPVPSPAPAPVNAIFEPLFAVVQHRKKSTAAPSEMPSQTNQTNVPAQSSGGKFERNIVTAAATRSIVSRWPTTATQQTRTEKVLTPRPRFAPETDLIVDPENAPTQAAVSSLTNEATPAAVPTKGLKSFVTKVKSTIAANSDQMTEDQSISP